MARNIITYFFITFLLFNECCCKKDEAGKIMEKTLKTDKTLLVENALMFEGQIKPDFEWYLRTVTKLSTAPKSLTLSADDCYQLWTNAYAYRDRLDQE